MKKLLAFFVMCFVATCYAAPPIKSHQVDRFSRPFDSLNQAAIAAVQESYKLSNHFEFGGLLVYSTETLKYYYTTPHTNLSIDSVYVDHDIVFPKHPEMTIVSEYHTHPCFPYTHVPTLFSPNDVHNYLAYDQVGYMGNFCTGAVQVWDPHDLDFLMELDGPDKFWGVDQNSAYEGEEVGKISLNKTSDIQESIFDGMRYFFDYKDATPNKP